MKLKKYRVVAAALCAAFLLCGITTTAYAGGGEEWEDGKEFFTIMAADESVFYLVIDCQRETENVYFLNAVTVADLMALAEPGGTSKSTVPNSRPPRPVRTLTRPGNTARTMAANMTTSPRGMRKKGRVENEFHKQPFGTGNETPPPAPGSPPGKAPGGLPVMWLSLLARHPLRLLLSEPFEKTGREVILA